MKLLRTLAALMKADILERTRRYSFLVTIAAALYLAYLVNDGTISVHIGNCKPVPNSAWTGMAVALCTMTFIGIVGFYVVKNAIERDRDTGVGQILAGTPVGTTLYMMGKLLSNFAVLAAVTGILAVAAVLMQTFKGEGLDIPAIVSPFLFLALPGMFFIGGIALFFESVKLLRGGFGNILFIFAYTALIAVPMETGIMSTDVFGLRLAIERIQADVRVVVPEYDGTFSIGMQTKEIKESKPMVWGGLAWTPDNIGYRALPIAYGLLLAVAAAGLFDRFASNAAGRRTGRLSKFMERVTWAPLQKIPGWILLPFEALFQRFATGRILVAELRLMLQGLPFWWYAVALGLWIASVATDPTSARADIFLFLWIWPVLLWSGMGTREKRFRTGSILFSAPRPLARQLPAEWGAGFLVGVFLASGLLLRLALNGETATFLSIIAGAVFIPSLALALGVWSGTSKTFEAIYVAFWYLGPAHHTPSIDFMATTDKAAAAGTPVAFAIAAAVLFMLAIGGRWRQITAA
jgi:hypothetical protein